MPNYNWVCGACSATNNATIEACTACGCPATSSYKERRAYKAAHDGTGPEVRVVSPEVVSQEVAQKLKRFRTAVALSVVLGGSISLASAYVVLQHFDWAASKAGTSLVGILGCLVTFGPSTLVLIRARCPRCSQPWLSQTHSDERHGWFPLWAFASSRVCGHCGLSVNARPPSENAV
jgi:hypothetical protein